MPWRPTDAYEDIFLEVVSTYGPHFGGSRSTQIRNAEFHVLLELQDTILAGYGWLT